MVGDVVANREMWKQPDVLEHVTDAASQIEWIPVGSRPAGDNNRSLVRLEETVDQLEDRALAGATPPDERQCFSGLDGQVEPSQHVRLAPLESNTAERDLGHG